MVGHVGEAHGGRGLVDVLAAGTRGAEDVHLDVLLPDVDLDRVVDVGIDEDRGERGVPAGLGVVGRDPDQPVDALLRLQVAVGVLALDLDGDRLDPRLFARQEVEDRDLKPVPLGPPDVHPHQHLGPVLRLGAAGARMDREQRVPAVLGTLEHGLELELLDAADQLVGLPGHLRLHGRVGLGREELGHLDRALDPLIQILIGNDPGLQGLEFLHRGPGGVGLGPEAGLRLTRLERGQAL